MSELRDTTAALRSFDKRLNSIEECLLVLVRNSEQQSEWRHEQRNEAQKAVLRHDAAERAMKQVQDACGAISHKVAEVVQRIENLAAMQFEGSKAINERVRQVELQQPPSDEITRP